MKTNKPKHDCNKSGIYSRLNNWFCSDCGKSVPAPEMPESVRQRCDDWESLSQEEYHKKYNLPWDGQEFVRTFKRLGFWKSVKKYGYKRTFNVFADL